jgi:hypothetical protein
MNNIPTAEEFLCIKGVDDSDMILSTTIHVVTKAMIDFAKLHLEAAQKAWFENATAEIELGNPYDPESGYPIVNKQSILNAYPLDLIK